MSGREYEELIKRENRRKRAHLRKVRRRRVRALSVLTLALMTSCVLFGKVFFSKATDNADPVYKYYTSIAVQCGDTLDSLADAYADARFVTKEDYIDEVMFINHMQDERINAGQYLVVPYYSSEWK